MKMKWTRPERCFPVTPQNIFLHPCVPFILSQKNYYFSAAATSQHSTFNMPFTTLIIYNGICPMKMFFSCKHNRMYKCDDGVRVCVSIGCGWYRTFYTNEFGFIHFLFNLHKRKVSADCEKEWRVTSYINILIGWTQLCTHTYHTIPAAGCAE